MSVAQAGSQRRMVNPEPLVSVVVPNYNKGPFVRSAAMSVLSQTLGNLELIFVDDASDDASASQLKELCRDDRRVRMIEHPTRMGPGAARNTGILAARGKFIALLDSDDVYSPVWLEHAVGRISSEGVDSIAYADWWLMDSDGNRLNWKRGHTTSSGFLFKDFLLRSLEVNSVLVAPRKCFLQAGLYDESIRWGEDYDFVLRLSKRFPFVYVDEEAYGYRLHSGNSWRGFSKKELYHHKADVLAKNIGAGRGLLSPDQMTHVEDRLISYYAKADLRWARARVAWRSGRFLPYLRGSLGVLRKSASSSLALPLPELANTSPTASEK
jgi:glycosyltransferase involved in cell wall biosynthesis